MSTSKETIRAWLKEGKKNGCTHMIVVCDTWDHTDSPIYCESPEKTLEQIEKMNTVLFRLMEVYDLRLDLGNQLSEHRAMHIPSPPKNPFGFRIIK